MPSIHPSAIIEGSVDLAPDVEVGPGCVIHGPVSVGAGTRLIGQVWLQGPLQLGAGNLCYPGCSLGFAPQSVSYEPDHPGEGLVIGDENTFREGVTIHRAMTSDGPTRAGSHNFMMAFSHLGHDAQLGDRCILANGAVVGGHAIIEDRVNIGGVTGVHQFCRVGEGAMLSGGVGVTKDVPPWFIVTAINVCGGVNLIGLRRGGFERADVDDARWAYRVLYRRQLPPKRAVELLRERAERPLIAQYIGFVESSERGICPGQPRARRGAVIT